MSSPRSAFPGSAQMWTRVIGWFQIIGCSMAVLYNLMNIVYIACFGLSGDTERIWTYGNDAEEDKKIVLTTIPSIAMTMVYSGGLAFAILLLKGSYQGVAKYLRWWVLYNWAATILILMWVLLSNSEDARDSLVGMQITAFCLAILTGLCFGIVRIHWREIEDEARRSGYTKL